MHLNHVQDARRGEVTGKTVSVYFLLWLLGVPGFILIILFLVGVGH
jgi:hypothetical protein